MKEKLAIKSNLELLLSFDTFFSPKGHNLKIPTHLKAMGSFTLHRISGPCGVLLSTWFSFSHREQTVLAHRCRPKIIIEVSGAWKSTEKWITWKSLVPEYFKKKLCQLALKKKIKKIKILCFSPNTSSSAWIKKTCLQPLKDLGYC